MTNKPDKLQVLNEQELDALLAQEAGALTPIRDAVPKITDWPRVKKQLFWGLMLNTVLLHFLNLQYILPTLGLMLLSFGLRELRQENGCFFAAWLAGIASLICMGIRLTIQGTVHGGALMGGVSLMGDLAKAICTILLLIGLTEMRKKAGLSPWTQALKTAFVLYLLWYPVALFLQSSNNTMLVWPIFLIMIFCQFRSLHMTLKQMQDVGYTAHITHKRLKDLPLGLLMLSLLLVSILCGMHFGQSYPMNWKPAEINTNFSAEDLARLEQQGIYAEDLAAMDGITCMLLKNAQTIHVERFGSKTSSLYSTLIAAKTDPNSKEWHAIYLFQWNGEDLSRGTAAVELSVKPALAAFRYDLPAAGYLRYEAEGQTYVSTYHKLEYTMAESASFFGSHRDLRLRATFSPPKGQSHYSGFVRFTVTAPDDIIFLNYEILLQKSDPLYPARSAEQALGSDSSYENFYRSYMWAVFE